MFANAILLDNVHNKVKIESKTILYIYFKKKCQMIDTLE